MTLQRIQKLEAELEFHIQNARRYREGGRVDLAIQALKLGNKVFNELLRGHEEMAQ